MGVFSTIKHGQIKSFTKGACKAMLFSFGVAEAEAKKGKLNTKLYSDLATETLSTRPKWKEIDKNTFQHSSGEKLKIKKDDNLASVILSVILIEMREFIFNDEHPEKILNIIVEEFQKIFSVSDEFLEKHEPFSQLTNLVVGDWAVKKYFKKGGFDF